MWISSNQRTSCSASFTMIDPYLGWHHYPQSESPSNPLSMSCDCPLMTPVSVLSASGQTLSFLTLLLHVKSMVNTLSSDSYLALPLSSPP